MFEFQKLTINRKFKKIKKQMQCFLQAKPS